MQLPQGSNVFSNLCTTTKTDCTSEIGGGRRFPVLFLKINHVGLA